MNIKPAISPMAAYNCTPVTIHSAIRIDLPRKQVWLGLAGAYASNG